MRTRVFIALVLIFGTLAGGSAPGVGASTRPKVGVQFHAMWDDYSNAQRSAVLDALAAAHVRWIRVDVGWDMIEHDAKGQRVRYEIRRLNSVVNGAAGRGMHVLVTLWRTPSWANGGAGPMVPPNDPQDYADFARWAARHWDGRIDAWEIWNEPNPTQSFWQGSAESYVGLLKAAYPAIKAGDPGAKVVLGGPSSNDTNWLSDVYAAGAHGSFDVMATHPYMAPSDLPPETPDTSGTDIYLMDHVRAVHDLMVRNGDGAKPIWFTEFGWSSHLGNAGLPNWEWGVSSRTQAHYLVRAIKFVAANHPYVTHMFWYTERDTESGNVHNDHYGLLHHDLSHKPAYAALRHYLASA
jgi:polysaccharide biosynthesis protein PslG